MFELLQDTQFIIDALAFLAVTFGILWLNELPPKKNQSRKSKGAKRSI